MEKKKYSIGQLAELSGVSRRTVRFYIQSGLLKPPVGSGRGAHYTEEHLDALQKINTQKQNKLRLDKISEIITGQPDPVKDMPVPTSWVRLQVCPGVEVHVQGGRYPVTPARIKKLQRFVHTLFGTVEDDSKGEDSDD